MDPNVTATNPNVNNTDRISQLMDSMHTNATAMGQYETKAGDLSNKYSAVNDPQVQAMRSAQSDKIQQLFAHDTNLAQTYFPIQNAPGPSTGNVTMPANNQAIVDPSIGLRAASGQTLSTAKELADISTDIGNRKDLLSEGLSKAMQMLQFGFQVKKAEQEALSTELNFMLDLKKLDAEKAKESESERQRRIADEFRQNARQGMTFSQAMRKYSSDLSPEDIMLLYNSNSKWGPVQATIEDINKKYGANIPLPAGETAAITRRQKAQETAASKLTDAMSLYNNIESESQGLAYGPGVESSLAGSFAGGVFNPRAKNYESARAATALQLADVLGLDKRVSEAERQAYLDLIPSIYETGEQRADKLRRLKAKIESDNAKYILGNTGASTNQGFNSDLGSVGVGGATSGGVNQNDPLGLFTTK